MAEDDGTIFWYDPDPRAIIPLDDRFHVSRSLQKTINKNQFEIKINQNFGQVMQHCAQRERTWISDAFFKAYGDLHTHGFAHSVEAYFAGELVGGLYGVSINGLFAGESKFSLMRDASKVALVHLVERMRRRGMTLLDTQIQNDHISQFGSLEIPREEYKLMLGNALGQPLNFVDSSPILQFKGNAH